MGDVNNDCVLFFDEDDVNTWFRCSNLAAHRPILHHFLDMDNANPLTGMSGNKAETLVGKGTSKYWKRTFKASSRLSHTVMMSIGGAARTVMLSTYARRFWDR